MALGRPCVRPQENAGCVSMSPSPLNNNFPASKPKNPRFPLNNNDSAQARYALGVIYTVNIIAAKSLGCASFTEILAGGFTAAFSLVCFVFWSGALFDRQRGGQTKEKTSPKIGPNRKRTPDTRKDQSKEKTRPKGRPDQREDQTKRKTRTQRRPDQRGGQTKEETRPW